MFNNLKKTTSVFANPGAIGGQPMPSYYTELTIESNMNNGIEYGVLVLKHPNYPNNCIAEFIKQNIITTSWNNDAKHFHVLLSIPSNVVGVVSTPSPIQTINIELMHTSANYFIIKINKYGPITSNETYVVQEVKFDPNIIFGN
jgi:hypothetical protein